MTRIRLQTAEERLSLRQLTLVDLCGRPFMHVQGRTVTRGFVWFLEVDDSYWRLFVKNVQYLNLRIGKWRPDETQERYGGELDHTYAVRYWSGLNPIFDAGIEIGGGGMVFHIGLQTNDPWSESAWPDQFARLLNSAPIEDQS